MIFIRKSATADSRTCDSSTVSKGTLERSSKQHIHDVKLALDFFRERLALAALVHDFDKLTDIDTFHKDFQSNFTTTEWWDRHRKLNRHHLFEADGVPADVNLLDVLELIADCVMAGMGRAGSVSPITLSPELLTTAFQNTVTLLQNQVVILPDLNRPTTPTE